MNLKGQQLKQVLKKLDGLWTNRTCSSCGTHKWIISDKIYELRQYAPKGSISISGNTVPVILAMCQKCGFTLTFNAIGLGVIDKDTGEFKYE